MISAIRYIWSKESILNNEEDTKVLKKTLNKKATAVVYHKENVIKSIWLDMQFVREEISKFYNLWEKIKTSISLISSTYRKNFPIICAEIEKIKNIVLAEFNQSSTSSTASATTTNQQILAHVPISSEISSPKTIVTTTPSFILTTPTPIQAISIEKKPNVDVTTDPIPISSEIEKVRGQIKNLNEQIMKGKEEADSLKKESSNYKQIQQENINKEKELTNTLTIIKPEIEYLKALTAKYEVFTTELQNLSNYSSDKTNQKILHQKILKKDKRKSINSTINEKIIKLNEIKQDLYHLSNQIKRLLTINNLPVTLVSIETDLQIAKSNLQTVNNITKEKEVRFNHLLKETHVIAENKLPIEQKINDLGVSLQKKEEEINQWNNSLDEITNTVSLLEKKAVEQKVISISNNTLHSTVIPVQNTTVVTKNVAQTITNLPENILAAPIKPTAVSKLFPNPYKMEMEKDMQKFISPTIYKIWEAVLQQMDKTISQLQKAQRKEALQKWTLKDGNFQIDFFQPIKLGLQPKDSGNNAYPLGGIVLLFDKTITGKLDASSHTMQISKGLHIYLKKKIFIKPKVSKIQVLQELEEIAEFSVEYMKITHKYRMPVSLLISQWQNASIVNKEEQYIKDHLSLFLS